MAKDVLNFRVFHFRHRIFNHD